MGEPWGKRGSAGTSAFLLGTQCIVVRHSASCDSGAVPSEKISWGKLDVDTPTFLIESDATIVAPLIFAYVLGH